MQICYLAGQLMAGDLDDLVLIQVYRSPVPTVPVTREDLSKSFLGELNIIICKNIIKRKSVKVHSRCPNSSWVAGASSSKIRL